MTENNNNIIFYACSTTAAALILLAIVVNSSVTVNGSASPTLEPSPLSTDNLLGATGESVAVGLGNQTAPINRFFPATLDIFEGQNVTFYAPPNSTEFHNVIFDLSNGSVISGLELPFILPQAVDPGQLALAPPFNLGQPIIKEQTDGSHAIIAFNKLAFYPGVADQQNNTRYLLDEEQLQRQSEEAMQRGFSFMPPNLSANYTINGTENLVSSGIVLDVRGFGPLEEEEPVVPLNATTTQATENTTAAGEGEVPTLPYPFLNNFTVTFEQPGIYEYFCAFHPTMIGVVSVADLTASEEEAEQAAPPLLLQ
jgi:hypothetical protein